MITFIKANIASLSASLLDYLLTILLVTFFRLDPVLGSVCGTVCGGIFNFIIGRNWVFKSKTRRVHQQAMRYALVWAGNLLLNTLGMWWLVKVMFINYIAAKLVVSVMVGFFYNYLLQKKFVFKHV